MIDKLRKSLEKEYDCEILFIGEYGSCTFNMHDENSDHDLIAIFKPTYNRFTSIHSRSEAYQVNKDKYNVDLKLDSIRHILKMIYKGNYSVIPPLLQKNPYYITEDFEIFDIINLYMKYFNRDKMKNHFARWGIGLTRSGGQEVKKKQMKTCYLIVHKLVYSSFIPLSFNLKKYAEQQNINLNMDEYQIRSFLKDNLPETIDKSKIDDNDFNEVYRKYLPTMPS